MTQMSFSEIKDRPFLTVEEASVYSHIGAESIRRLIAEPNSDFAVRVGKKTLIKRDLFVKYIEGINIIY